MSKAYVDTEAVERLSHKELSQDQKDFLQGMNEAAEILKPMQKLIEEKAKAESSQDLYAGMCLAFSDFFERLLIVLSPEEQEFIRTGGRRAASSALDTISLKG